MGRPDGFAAAIPGDDDLLKRASLRDSRYDQHRAAASEDDRVCDRQRMGFRRALPLVLTKDDKVGGASVADNAPTDIFLRAASACARPALRCLLPGLSRARARVCRHYLWRIAARLSG